MNANPNLAQEKKIVTSQTGEQAHARGREAIYKFQLVARVTSNATLDTPPAALQNALPTPNIRTLQRVLRNRVRLPRPNMDNWEIAKRRRNITPNVRSNVTTVMRQTNHRALSENSPQRSAN